MSATYDSPDWLESPSVGGFVLASFSGLVASGGNVSTGVFACGPAPFLILSLKQAGGANSLFQARFWQDPAGTIAVADPFQFLSSGANILKRVVIPVMGAYCSVVFFNGAVANNPTNMTVWAASTGVTAAGTLGGGITVLSEQAVVLGAGATNNYTPGFYLPGQATLWFSGVANTFAQIQKWNGIGWDYVLQIPGGLSVVPAVNLVLPSDDYRLQLNNSTAGNVTLYAVVTAL